LFGGEDFRVVKLCSRELEFSQREIQAVLTFGTVVVCLMRSKLRSSADGRLRRCSASRLRSNPQASRLGSVVGSCMSTEELLAQVLQLPRQDRARVADELLSSLEEADDEEVARTWAPELERRSREVVEGKVQTVEWGSARADLKNELEERRARRTAS
jgi:hypothetical protein